jgi:hypothetical protein
MMTFVLAAAMLVAALCVAVALDGAPTEAPPGVVVAYVLDARLLATDQTVPVARGVRLNTDRGRPRNGVAKGQHASKNADCSDTR